MQRKRTDFKLTHSCNNNCRFCGEAGNRLSADRSTEQVKAALSKTPPGINELVLTGGEPTTYPDFPEIASFASRIFTLVQVQTNARMFSYPEFASRVSGLHNLQFFVSLTSHLAPVHDSLTQAKGSFRQTLAGIANLKSQGSFVILNHVITKKTFRSLPDFTGFASGLGIDQLQFSFVHPIGNALANYKEIVPRISDVAPKLRSALDISASNNLKCLVEGVPACFLPGHESSILEFHYRHSLMSPDPRSLKGFGRGKPSCCPSCRYDRACFGTWDAYLEKEGDSEFSPVKGPAVPQASVSQGIRLV